MKIFGQDAKLVENGTELSENMWSIVVEAFKYSAKYSSTIDPKYSLYDFFEEKVKDLYPKHDQNRQRNLILQMAELWGAFVGSSVKTQSLKFFWLEECIDGGTIRFLQIRR